MLDFACTSSRDLRWRPTVGHQIKGVMRASVTSWERQPERWGGATHLTQRALHRSQEVSFSKAVVAAVDVKQLEAKTLHLLKIKIQGENLWVGGVDTAPDHLGPVHLQEAQTEQWGNIQ